MAKPIKIAIPYGYCIFQGRMMVDSEEMAICKMIVALRETGMSYRTIAKHLDSLNILTKKKNRPWKPQSVLNIVRRHYELNG